MWKIEFKYLIFFTITILSHYSIFLSHGFPSPFVYLSCFSGSFCEAIAFSVHSSPISPAFSYNVIISSHPHFFNRLLQNLMMLYPCKVTLYQLGSVHELFMDTLHRHRCRRSLSTCKHIIRLNLSHLIGQEKSNGKILVLLGNQTQDLDFSHHSWVRFPRWQLRLFHIFPFLFSRPL